TPGRGDEVPTPRERRARKGQHKPAQEPPRHVGELGIWSALRAYQLRLERHAADRAGAWSDLPDLRMHRTGIDCIGRHRRTGRGPLREIAGRVSREFAPPAGRAAVEGAALM